MARPFSVDAARNSFELPPLTRQQIQALILDLDLDAREVVIVAIQQLWQREIGEPERDVLAELDELKTRLTALETPHDAAKEDTMFYAVAHHGTAGLGDSFGYAEVVEEAPRVDQTTTIAGPYADKAEAENVAAEWDRLCEDFRTAQDAR